MWESTGTEVRNPDRKIAGSRTTLLDWTQTRLVGHGQRKKRRE